MEQECAGHNLAAKFFKARNVVMNAVDLTLGQKASIRIFGDGVPSPVT